MSAFKDKLDEFIKNINEISHHSGVPKWFKPFSDSFKTFASDISELYSVMDAKMQSLEASLVVQKAVTDALLVEKDRLQDVIKKLEHEVDDQQQYSRRNCLIVHGIDEKPNENTDKIVMDLLQNKLEAGVTQNEVSRTHRLGRKREDNKARPIIMRLISYRQRKKIFDSKKMLRGQRILITENETISRHIFA